MPWYDWPSKYESKQSDQCEYMAGLLYDEAGLSVKDASQVLSHTDLHTTALAW